MINKILLCLNLVLTTTLLLELPGYKTSKLKIYDIIRDKINAK